MRTTSCANAPVATRARTAVRVSVLIARSPVVGVAGRPSAAPRGLKVRRSVLASAGGGRVSPCEASGAWRSMAPRGVGTAAGDAHVTLHVGRHDLFHRRLRLHRIRE